MKRRIRIIWLPLVAAFRARRKAAGSFWYRDVDAMAGESRYARLRALLEG